MHRNKALSPPRHPTVAGGTSDGGGKRKYDSMGSEADIDHGRSETRLVSLGSRKQLCLNEKLKAKGGDLDEHCRELLQGTILLSLYIISGDEFFCAAEGDKRCPYLPKPDAVEDSRLHDFRDQILVRLFPTSASLVSCVSKASPKDIEDLVTAGQASHTCPYFASREAVSQAEVPPFLQFDVPE